MVSNVFISYRRDSHAMARSIAERLTREGFSVFLDADRMRQGDFEKQVSESVATCDVLLALITNGSLDRCREDPQDYCRMEMALALEYHKPVVLVAEDRHVELGEQAFPPELVELARLNALFYSHERFDDFMVQVFEYLEATPSSILVERWRNNTTVEQSQEFRSWLVARLRDSIPGLPGAEVFPIIAGQEYPVVVQRAVSPWRPFNHSQSEHELQLPLRDPNEITYRHERPETPGWIVGEHQLEYFELLRASRSVKRWNLRGFALTKLILNNDGHIVGSKSTLSTYGENCLTSHVLKHQLIAEYLGQSHRMDRPSLALESSGNVIVRWDGAFFPLISVQAILLINDVQEGPKTLVMQRSEDVAAMAGFWQFPPAGGFEILGTEDEDPFVVRRQFDLLQALLRELLEEVWGDDDLTSAGEVNPELAGSTGYRMMREAIAQGRIAVHLLGVVTDAVSLRPEFSFLVVVEDPSVKQIEYQTDSGSAARWLRRSSEARRMFEFTLSEVDSHMKDDGPWNPSSAGLYQLLSEAIQDRWVGELYPWICASG